ncbi:hypothetical protein [Helicobacter cappadocius]|uniref:Uncharacterized protein n=1 Tax=Helicobacter cappadocius TaxID=3063998 RepID=A0AA90T9L8_9HELI|nr:MULTISPECIES: hypothetical protein [unclassified Helicobacter]MDO7253009.1 hypothetical protein [Helicobacter sp. faydin-H75]MDP2539002.1 hypothetical protein [Helicobacter sp. faydin-H76]
MLEHVKSLAQLSKVGTEIKNITEFNATLPILLKVLSKAKNGEFLLKMGNTTITTKSQKELLVGQKYWANMSKSSVGAIILSNLVRPPKMLEMIEKSPLKFSIQDLDKIFKESKLESFGEYKDFLLDKLLLAQNRSEFLNLGNLLLSLHNEVVSLVISDEHKDGLVQVKKSKNKKQSLEFYALYPHLGALNGRVYLLEDGVGLEIWVLYESVKKILEANKDKLKGFQSIAIYQEKDIRPLFEFEEGVLDIRA